MNPQGNQGSDLDPMPSTPPITEIEWINIAKSRALDSVMADIGDVLLERCDLFMHDQKPVLLHKRDVTRPHFEDEQPPIQNVTGRTLSALASVHGVVLKRPGRPPKHEQVPQRVFDDMHEVAGTWITDRNLVGFTNAPFLGPQGIVDTPGFNAVTGYYNRYPHRLNPVTDAQITEVLARLIDWYPWSTPEDHAKALAMHFTPLVRPAIHGATPAFVVSAHREGMGKTQAISQPILIAHGVLPTMQRYDAIKDDVYAFGALLATGRPYQIFDNVETGSKLGSPALDMAITSGKIAERIVRSGTASIMSVRPFWGFTGNGLTLTRDMASRSQLLEFSAGGETRVRAGAWADYDREKQEGREGIDSITWVGRNRAHVLDVLFACIQRWIDAGKPPPPRSMGRSNFDEWSTIVGGIVCFLPEIMPKAATPEEDFSYLRTSWQVDNATSADASGWTDAIVAWPGTGPVATDLGSVRARDLLWRSTDEIIKHLEGCEVLLDVLPIEAHSIGARRSQAGKYFGKLAKNLTPLCPGWYLERSQDKAAKHAVFRPCAKSGG
jgi:hypothetical protein